MSTTANSRGLASPNKNPDAGPLPKTRLLEMRTDNSHLSFVIDKPRRRR